MSTEQRALKMIWFDATAGHPHWCVLAIMSTFGFGTGRENACNRKNNEATDWLLNCDQRENIILGARAILNETSLDP